MKVLHLSTSDISGGAAKAAHRLHMGLKKIGIESQMLVQRKQSNDSEILGKTGLFWRSIFFIKGQIEKLPLRFYFSRKREIFHVGNISTFNLTHEIKEINPDIINIHWINGGFLSINQLEELKKLNKVIVWTLHDSWAFTGGCHIPYFCERYREKCGNCPILCSKREKDLSRSIWLNKKEIFDKVNFTVVTPSNWLKECAKSSSLLKNKRIVRIANSIDLNKFKLIDYSKVRKDLGLSENKKYLLFGAMSATTDKNKGFDLLIKSLSFLKKSENMELLVFGNNNEFKEKIKIPIRYFGIIKDQKKLNDLYSVADVTIMPSRSENFPNSILESFSCGIPCVAFEVGGISEIINHKKNGYLAKPYDVKDLANGIEFCLSSKELGLNARKKAKREYTLKTQANNYKKLYQSLQ